MNNTNNLYKTISVDSIISGYKVGIFPMAEDKNSKDIFWVSPQKRGVINLEKLSIGRNLKKLINKNTYILKVDTDFIGVIEGCASIGSKRENTWINSSIMDAYINLHYQGYAHSVECYSNNLLVGGLYGVSLGGIFFGESMFSIAPEASKISLLHLMERLKIGNFSILDTQFITDHLKKFGAIEVNQKEFLKMLKDALKIKANFFKMSPVGALDESFYPKIKNFK